MTQIVDYTSQLPQGWTWTNLNDVALAINPGFPSGKWQRTEGQFIPHLRPMNIDSKGTINLSEVKYVQFQNTQPLMKGDILFNNTNSPKLIGKTTYIKEDTNWAYSNHMTRIKVHSLINPGYVSHYLHHLFLRGFFFSKCLHHVNQASVNSTFLKEKVPIPLAPPAEQVRIVSKVEALFSFLDAGTESLRKVQAQLKRYRQAILKHAFEGKLTEEWRKARKDRMETAQVLLKRITEKQISNNSQWKNLEPIIAADLPEIPPEWMWVRAQEVCENITNGYTPKASELHKRGGEIPFIKINNLTFNGKLDFSKNSTFIDRQIHDKMLKRSKIFPGDVLINIVGPPLGKVSIVSNEYPEWNINQAIVFFRPIEGYNRDFLALCLQTKPIISQLTNQAKATAGQFNISVNMSRNLPIPLPPKEEQEKIVLDIRKNHAAIESAKTTMDKSLKQAEYLRNSILKSAFSGQLVPQDPSDEPAEMLLHQTKEQKSDRNKSNSKGLMSYVK